MTYKELKQKQKRISELNTKIAKLRADAESITQKLSKAPCSSGIKDKIGKLVTEIAYYEDEKKALISEIESAIQNIPDDMIGNWLRLKINKKFSWKKIACLAGGNNTHDSVRKACVRKIW